MDQSSSSLTPAVSSYLLLLLFQSADRMRISKKKMYFMIFSHKVILDTISDTRQDHWGLYNISTVSIFSSNFANLFIAFLLHSVSSQQ